MNEQSAKPGDPSAPKPDGVDTAMKHQGPCAVVALPSPSLAGDLSLEAVIASRRSIREFTGDSLSLDSVAQLVWAAQGVTAEAAGRRASPSAGALYPLELYVVLAGGMYHYDPARHELRLRCGDDLRPDLCRAALSQESVAEAPAVFVFTGVYERTVEHYGRRRGRRYVKMEVGHAAQNLLLQAAALGLGAVPIGAFDDSQAAQVLNLKRDESPLYLIPVGHGR